MNKLTRQEQLVLITVLSLLVVGWVVKVFRTANPPVGKPIENVRTNS
ncbi:hypothetical protein LBMAG56_13490 [Verrucomicrobiota bacterium]|nr:hypothetical protein LBMAG56_13490 [Verrucomicrobiota bacterium]